MFLHLALLWVANYAYLKKTMTTSSLMCFRIYFRCNYNGRGSSIMRYTSIFSDSLTDTSRLSLSVRLELIFIFHKFICNRTEVHAWISCSMSLSNWMLLLLLLHDKLLTLLLMPLQVDVIIGRWQIHRVTAVSYTHLTLPTILRV